MIYFNPYLLATAVTLTITAIALGSYTLVLGNRLLNLLIGD